MKEFEMNSKETEAFYEEKEKPRESRQKISKKRAIKKSDHKHEYEPIIIEYTYDKSFLKDKIFRESAKRCTICGRLDLGFPDEFNHAVVQPYFKKHYPQNRFLFSSEYCNDNPDKLEVVKVKDPFKLNDVNNR